MSCQYAPNAKDRERAFVGWARLKYVARVGAVKGVGLGREAKAEDKNY